MAPARRSRSKAETIDFFWFKAKIFVYVPKMRQDIGFSDRFQDETKAFPHFHRLRHLELLSPDQEKTTPTSTS